MKLQITRILKDELARLGEPLPIWIDTFLYTINQFIDQVGKTLKGQITFADNVLCKVVTITLVHNTEYVVSPTLAGKSGLTVLGVIPVIAQKSTASASSASRNVITGWGTNLLSNGNLGIVAQFSAGGITQAAVTFIILFG